MKFVFYCYAVSLCLEELSDIFGDNLARFGDLAKFLAKNEFSRNFKSRVCKNNRKRDTAEYSRTFREIVNVACQALPLLLEERCVQRETLCFELWVLQLGLFYEYICDINFLLYCCYLKCYVSFQKYYLCIWLSVKSAALCWVWTTSLWITATGSACLFQKFLLKINILSYKGPFIDSQLHEPLNS